ncbi:MAG: hypothetical protein U0166_07125 [Acidobacteriota bacterium]
MALSKDEKKIIYADVIALVKTCLGGPWASNVKDPNQLLRDFYDALKVIREDVIQDPDKDK